METNNQINSDLNERANPRLSFKEAVGECISKYAIFSGRARRSEYWWFYLFALMVVTLPSVAMLIVALVLEGKVPVDPDNLSTLTEGIDGVLVVLSGLIYLFLTIPVLAVQVRRLHDTGRSGWWLLWSILASLPYEITSHFVLDGAANEKSYDIMNVIQGFQVSALGGSMMLLLGLLKWGVAIAILIFVLQDSYKGENQYGPSPKYP